MINTTVNRFLRPKHEKLGQLCSSVPYVDFPIAVNTFPPEISKKNGSVLL